MTLLDEVIEGASGSAPLAQLLRQIKVLAARTRTAALAAWVGHELDGYPNAAELPSYRGPFSVRPLGHFIGPFQQELKNVEIPPSTFHHADVRELREGILFKRHLTEPIATIEAWSKQEVVQFGWPADAVRMYHLFVQNGRINRIVREDMVLVGVHMALPGTTFLEILEAVRTKILDLALELEQVAPLAGERDVPANQAEPAAAVINNHFHAPSNVAIGGERTTQVVVSIPQPDDHEGLLRYLGAAGVPPEQLLELTQALAQDQASDAGDGRPGWSRTRAWFARATTDTTTNAFGGAIVAAATAFLGG